MIITIPVVTFPLEYHAPFIYIKRNFEGKKNLPIAAAKVWPHLLTSTAARGAAVLLQKICSEITIPASVRPIKYILSTSV